MTLDTADLIKLKSTGDRWLVCCVHPPIAWLNRPGMHSAYLDDIELVKAATAAERNAMLKLLAESSGEGHRPRCARSRLNGGSDAG